MKKKYFIALSLLFYFLLSVVSQKTIHISDFKKEFAINHYKVFSNKDSVLYYDIVNKYDKDFYLPADVPLDYGFFYWLKIKVSSSSDNEYWILDLGQNITYIELFETDYYGTVHSSLGGVLVPYSKRTVKEGGSESLVYFKIKKNTQKFIYLCLFNKFNKKISLNNMSISSYYGKIEKRKKLNFFLGMFNGVLLLLIIVSIISYFIFFYRSFLYYILYLISQIILFAHIYNYTAKYIFYDFPELDVFLLWFVYVGLFSYVLFLRNILNTKKNMVKIDKLLQLALYYLGVILIVYAFWIYYDFARFKMFSDYLNILNILFTIYVVVLLYNTKNIVARIIALGSLIMAIGAGVTIFLQINYLHTNSVVPYQLGVLIEILFFSIALIYKYYLIDTDKNRAMIESLKTDNANRIKLIDLKSLKEKANEQQKVLEANANAMLRTSETINFVYTEIINLQNLPSLKNATIKAKIRELLNNIEIQKRYIKNKEFEESFDINNEVLYTKLRNIEPKISLKELRLCALIKLEYSSKDIASITFQDRNTVDVARYRLRKKLNIETKRTLSEYFKNL